MARKNRNPKRRQPSEDSAQGGEEEPKRIKVPRDSSKSNVHSPGSGSESGRSILKDRGSVGDASPKKNVKWDAKVIESAPVPEEEPSMRKRPAKAIKASPKAATGVESEKTPPPVHFFGPDVTLETGEEMLQFLLGDIPVKKFFAEYWEKKPLVIHRKRKDYYRQAFNKKVFLDIVEEKDLLFQQNMAIVRYADGERMNVEPIKARATREELETLFDSGCTVQFFQPQRHVDALWQVNSLLENYFGTLVGASAYLTPGKSQGLAPHYDDVDVFILQTEGKKSWKLYKPVDELPITCSEDLPESEIGEPTHEFELTEGDLLYFPRGTVHQASTPGAQFSTHVTVSTYQQHTWGDFLQLSLPIVVRQMMEQDVELRRGLPLNYLSYMGTEWDVDLQIKAQPQSSELVKKMENFLHKFKGKLATIKDTLELGQLHIAADEASSDFMANRLPPLIQRPQTKSLGPSPLDEDSEFRFVDKNAMRMVVTQEEGGPALSLQYSVKNKRPFHMGPPGAASGKGMGGASLMQAMSMGLFGFGGDDGDDEDGEEGEEEEDEEGEEEESNEEESEEEKEEGKIEKGHSKGTKEATKSAEVKSKEKILKMQEDSDNGEESEEGDEAAEGEESDEDEEDSDYEDEGGMMPGGLPLSMLGLPVPPSAPRPQSIQFPFQAALPLLHLLKSGRGFTTIKSLDGDSEVKTKVVVKLWSKGLLEVRKIKAAQ